MSSKARRQLPKALYHPLPLPPLPYVRSRTRPRLSLKGAGALVGGWGGRS